MYFQIDFQLYSVEGQTSGADAAPPFSVPESQAEKLEGAAAAAAKLAPNLKLQNVQWEVTGGLGLQRRKRGKEYKNRGKKIIKIICFLIIYL